MAGRAVGGGHVGHHQSGSEHARCLLQVGQATRSRGFGVREDYIHSKGRRVAGEDFQVLGRRKAPGLPRLRHEVKYHHPPRGGDAQRGREFRD